LNLHWGEILGLILNAALASQSIGSLNARPR
jgi:hypothetical protein